MPSLLPLEADLAWTLDFLTRSLEQQTGWQVCLHLLDPGSQQLIPVASPSLLAPELGCSDGISPPELVRAWGASLGVAGAQLLQLLDRAFLTAVPGPECGSLDLLERGARIVRLALESQAGVGDYHLLVNAIPQLAWMAHADGHIFWYNDRWYEYTGTTPEQMEGWGWKSVHDPQVLPAVMSRWQESLSTGVAFEMEFPLRRADGAYRTFLTRVAPLRAENGAILRWFGTNTDVDELRKYREERELLLSNAEASRREAMDLSQQLTRERDKLRESNQDLMHLSEQLRQEQEAQAQLAHFLRAANRGVVQITLADTTGEKTRVVLDLLIRTFRARVAGIWLQSPGDRNQLELVASHELETDSTMVSASLDVRYNAYKLGWVARFGKPYTGVIEPGDVQFDHHWLRSRQLGYAILLPLLERDRVVGLLTYFAENELPGTVPEVLSTVAVVYASQLRPENSPESA